MSESLQVTSFGSYEICLTSDQGSFSVYKSIPNDFDPQTIFFKCDKTKSGGVMLPWLTARQEYQIRRNTSHFTEHLSNLKDIRNSHSFQHVVPISTLYTDFLGISWPSSIASKNRPFRRSKIMRKLSYCCLIFAR